MEQENFDKNFKNVVSGEITPTQLRRQLEMTHSTKNTRNFPIHRIEALLLI